MIPCVGLSEAKQAFQSHGVVVIKEMFDADEVRELLGRLRSTFKPSFDGEGEIGPWKRAQVLRRVDGGTMPRYVRMLYEPPERPVFQRLIELRNWLAGQRSTWAVRPEDGWWTAARFNQYPKGGGWMAEHTDAGYVGAEPPGGFVQPMLCLTERGRDYQDGGAYVRTIDGVIDMEPYCRAGDVMVYDGSIRHGVAPIDLGERDSGFSGRVVAAVTPLRVL